MPAPDGDVGGSFGEEFDFVCDGGGGTIGVIFDEGFGIGGAADHGGGVDDSGVGDGEIGGGGGGAVEDEIAVIVEAVIRGHIRGGSVGVLEGIIDFGGGVEAVIGGGALDGGGEGADEGAGGDGVDEGVGGILRAEKGGGGDAEILAGFEFIEGEESAGEAAAFERRARGGGVFGERVGGRSVQFHRELLHIPKKCLIGIARG